MVKLGYCQTTSCVSGSIARIADRVATAGTERDRRVAQIEGPHRQVDDVRGHTRRPPAAERHERAVRIGVVDNQPIVGPHGVGPDPAFPVEPCWRGLLGGLPIPCGPWFMTLNVRDADLAEVAGADQFDHAAVVGPGVDLRADLADPLMLADGVANGQALGEVQRHRLLQVEVFAGPAGIDGHQAVPVRRSADDHAVQVFALEQLAVVGVGLG